MSTIEILTKKAAEAAKLIESLNVQIAAAKAEEEKNRAESIKRGNALIEEMSKYLKSPELKTMTEKEMLKTMQAWIFDKMPMEAEKNKRIPNANGSKVHATKSPNVEGIKTEIKAAVATLPKATKEEIIKAVTAKGYPEKEVKQRLYDAAYAGKNYKGAYLIKNEAGVYSLIVK